MGLSKQGPGLNRGLTGLTNKLTHRVATGFMVVAITTAISLSAEAKKKKKKVKKAPTSASENAVNPAHSVATQLPPKKTELANNEESKATLIAAADTLGVDTKTAPSVTLAPAGQTTTTTIEGAKAEDLKKFTGSAVILAETGADSYSGVRAQAQSKVTSYLTLGYKLNKQDKISVRQYYNSSINREGQMTKGGMGDQAVIYGHSSEKGFLGSQPVTSLAYLFAPTSEASKAAQMKIAARYDAEPTWELSPKVSAGYFFSPRYSVMNRHEDLDAATGSVTHYDNTLKLVHFGTLYYNVSDATQAYIQAGLRHVYLTGANHMNEEDFLSAVGMSFTMGSFILNPEINTLNPLKLEGNKNEAPWVAENVTYALTGVVTF